MPSHYDKYFDASVETLPREEIERLQEARILQLVPYVYNRAPLTRHIWDQAGVHPDDIKSLQDYKDKAPFINKDTIREFRDNNSDPFGGLCCVVQPHLKGIGFTSGTTGDPTPVPRAKHTLSMLDLKRCFWHMGLRPKDYFINAMFTFREGQTADRCIEADFKPINFCYKPSEVVPRIIEASLKYRPKVFFMLSTPMVTAIEKYVRDRNIDIKEAFASYQGAVFGGEMLGDSMRQRINSWGLEVYEYTTLGDVCGAMQCSAHDGMHAWEDLALVEVLDPDGSEPVADGEVGELVVTALMDDVAPLVRFRTDDLVKITREPCSCGRTHARFWPLGRKGDQIIVRGKSILPRDLLPIFQTQAETSSGLFQIILRSREADTLELRVGYDASVTGDPAELKSRLLELVSNGMEVPVAIDLVVDDELLKLGPPQKIPRVTKS